MKVLFLAPQPFYQERGTPIAVKLAAEALAERYLGFGQLDLLVYHEGSSVEIPGVNLHRIRGCSFIKGVGPGISVKKLICDFFFLISALYLVFMSRRDQYNVIHAVEESVFVALIIKWLFKIPYLYDMDSSIALQATEKWWILRPLYPILSWFEKIGVKYSEAVVPVCDSLAAIADRHGSKDTHILRDVSLVSPKENSQVDLRSEIQAKETGDGSDLIVTYVGNLESYQGVDLLVDTFLSICPEFPSIKLVIIGGSEEHIEQQRKRIKLNPSVEQVYFLGARPVENLGEYLKQSDILVSPRTKGNNTPMKIYSYLHAGRAILATNLPTHTQVLNDDVSLLVDPTINAVAEGLKELILNKEVRVTLGLKAFQYAEANFTLEVFKQRLNSLYQKLESRIIREKKVAVGF